MSRINGESFIVGLDHIQLAMPPGQENVADGFYCDVLGFQRMTKPSYLEKRGGRWYVSNGVQVHLGVEQAFAPARKAHPGLVVYNLRRLKERLEAAGIAIVWDTQISGFERFYASDPFGNRLEFMQPVAASAT
jgi:hypothetical protein